MWYIGKEACYFLKIYLFLWSILPTIGPWTYHTWDQELHALPVVPAGCSKKLTNIVCDFMMDREASMELFGAINFLGHIIAKV